MTGNMMSHRLIKEDSGFGLVELMVAMVLLGLIAVSFLPFMVQSVKSVDRDVTISAATQIVNERLNLAKNAGVQNCVAFQGAIADINAATVTSLNDGLILQDGRGLPLTATLVLSDLNGTVKDANSFACEANMQVSIRVSGPLRGQSTDYTYARASAYIRVSDVTSDGS